ncbi:probable malonyl-CoA-acyl carrier protein transacylase, mitochondrial [Parasteatoda tepidariorum]|uniref:probable malonyl-CoA-acyl carrier protein transacylase, mitochondrial n=1 Tax=Parasteatoda tepidariorum TaxID=114398 RepID=UPI0039BC6346
MSKFKFFRLLRKSNFMNNRSIFLSVSLRDSQTLPKKPNLKSLLNNSISYIENNVLDPWITPEYSVRRNNQSDHSIRLNVNPRETSVLLFPGQGSQFVGMGKSLLSYPNVKDMFECASEILRYNLLDLCINGPQDMLNMTVHSQVAVVVTSLAAVEKLRAESPKAIENCAATAGFSVGEYSALVFSGALEFEHAIKLLKVRGEAMQAASDLEPSGMMTVFLHPSAKIKSACVAAREWCEKQTIYNAECKVAIYMFPDCKVLAGHMEALKFLESNAKEFGIKKMKYIPVSGAFHSKLMNPAKVVLKKALKATPFETPIIPVHANVDGRPYSSAEKIREKLANQLCSAVAWEQTMHIIYERPPGDSFPDTYECGPGTALKSILRFNNAPAYKRLDI